MGEEKDSGTEGESLRDLIPENYAGNAFQIINPVLG